MRLGRAALFHISERATGAGMSGTRAAGAVAGYRPYLDGLRALCILFTIANHVQGMPWWVNGSVGVDIFFALSGWLITWLLLTEYSRVGRIDLRAFYIRRVFRIVPLYVLMIFVYGVVATQTGGGARAGEFFASLPYMLTFTMEYRSDAIGPMFQPAWTLGIEEKFYLAWPVLLLLAGLRRWRAWAGGAIGVVVLFAIFGVTPLLIRGYVGLGCGTTVALLAWNCPRVMRALVRWPLAGPMFAGATLWYVGSIFAPHAWGWNVLIAAFSAVAIASAWLKPGQTVNHVLSQSWLTWLGTLTYAIYLVQSLVIAVVERGLVRLGLPDAGGILYIGAYGSCVLVATVLHRLIERPLIARGRRLARGGSV